MVNGGLDFNPRTREGCDGDETGAGKYRLGHFNPRTREGCDAVVRIGLRQAVNISIHAPVKGATSTNHM